MLITITHVLPHYNYTTYGRSQEAIQLTKGLKLFSFSAQLHLEAKLGSPSVQPTNTLAPYYNIHKGNAFTKCGTKWSREVGWILQKGLLQESSLSTSASQKEAILSVLSWKLLLVKLQDTLTIKFHGYNIIANWTIHIMNHQMLTWKGTISSNILATRETIAITGRFTLFVQNWYTSSLDHYWLGKG